MKQNQLCPNCKKAVAYNQRYPGYLCLECVDLVTDKNGRPLHFHNTHAFGYGCGGSYKDSNAKYLSSKCYISNIECKADEARFGGIVIQPIEYYEVDFFNSSSDAQQTSEKFILESFNKSENLQLRPIKFQLPNSASVQIDGIDFHNSSICEIYARIGKLKGAQFDKIASDILKMIFIEKSLNRRFKKYLCFTSEEITSYFFGKSWLAKTTTEYNIIVRTVSIPENLQQSIKLAQIKQTMASPIKTS